MSVTGPGGVPSLPVVLPLLHSVKAPTVVGGGSTSTVAASEPRPGSDRHRVGSVPLPGTPLGTNLIGTGQTSTGQVGTGQTSTGQVGTGQTGQFGTGQFGASPIGAGQVGSPLVSAGQIGANQLGTGRFGVHPGDPRPAGAELSAKPQKDTPEPAPLPPLKGLTVDDVRAMLGVASMINRVKADTATPDSAGTTGSTGSSGTSGSVAAIDTTQSVGTVSQLETASPAGTGSQLAATAGVVPLLHKVKPHAGSIATSPAIGVSHAIRAGVLDRYA